MKKLSISSFNLISTQQMEELTGVVKETLAPGFYEPAKIFTAGDLWNIQRQAKCRRERRVFN